MSEIPLKQVIDASIENIRNVIDANTIVGTPITVSPEITVIPVSKVSCGFTSGGVDFDGKQNPKREVPHFGGGNAAGVSVTPVTFIVITGNDVRLMNVNGTNVSSESAIVGTICDVVEKSPKIIAKIKELFAGKNSSEKDGVKKEADK